MFDVMAAWLQNNGGMILRVSTGRQATLRIGAFKRRESISGLRPRRTQIRRIQSRSLVFQH
jgi:hypothetical protein